MYYDNYNGYFFVALAYCKIKQPTANTAQLQIRIETFLLRTSWESLKNGDGILLGNRELRRETSLSFT